MTGFPYDVKCEIAFTDPGATAVWTDITSRLISFSCHKGQQYDYDGPQPGKLSVTLDNTDGAFDPTNTSGAYYPNVKLKRQVRISAQETNVSARVYLAHGYVDSITRSWPGGMAFSETTLECTDATQYLNRTTYTSLVVSAGTADLHMQVVGNAATPSPAGGLAVVATTYNGNAWEFVTNLAIADGGLFYANGQDGANIYLTSTYLTSSTRSTTSQETFAFGLSNGTEVETDGLLPALDDRILANKITVTDSAGVDHTASDTSSQSAYGLLEFSIDTRGPGGTGLTGTAAATRASAVLTRRAQPYQRLESLILDALTGSQQMTDALGLQMGDLVTLTTQPLGGGAAVSTTAIITGVGHDVSIREPQWRTTYQIERP